MAERRKILEIKELCRSFLTLCVSLIAFSQAIFAQDDAMLSQYWAVPTYYNPSAVGSTDFLRIRGGARLQWVGMEDSPRTIVATADAPFKILGKNLGVGLMVQHQKEGLYRNINVGAQLGYKIRLFEGELAIGLQVGYINDEYRGSEFVADEGVEDWNDEGAIPELETLSDLPTTDVSGGAVDIGIGAYYHRGGTWVGVSLLHANKPAVKFSSTGESNRTQLASDEEAGPDNKESAIYTPRQLYFTVGSNIQVKNTLLELIPSMLVRTDFTHTDFVLTGRARYNKLISAGVGYRYRDAVSVMLTFEYQGFFIGYDYDIITGPKGRSSSGSHEILAGYSLKLDFGGKTRYKQKSIRIL